MLRFYTAEAVPTNVVALCGFRGQLWAACYGQGLFFWDGRRWHFQPRSPKYITGLSADADRLWFCTWMEGEIGFVRRERTSPIMIPLPRLVTPRFAYRNLCITADTSNVWVGSQSYLLCLDKGSKEQKPEWKLVIASGSISSIVSIKNGTWVASRELWVYREDARGFSFRAIRSDISITNMALDPSGKELWVSSDDEREQTLWRYETGNGRWEAVVKFAISPTSTVTAILPLKRSIYVSVGSYGFTATPTSSVQGGVGVYDRRSHQWRWLEGIRIRDVKSLAIFKNHLWIGGAEGIQAIQVSLE
jgi:hypothetical protein